MLKEHDVICGRSKLAFANAGNKFFRFLVHRHKDVYQNAKNRDEKKKIANEVIQSIQRHGGRFLKFTGNDSQRGDIFKEASCDYIYEKVSHALRSSRASIQVAPTSSLLVHKKPPSDVPKSLTQAQYNLEDLHFRQRQQQQRNLKSPWSDCDNGVLMHSVADQATTKAINSQSFSSLTQADLLYCQQQLNGRLASVADESVHAAYPAGADIDVIHRQQQQIFRSTSSDLDESVSASSLDHDTIESLLSVSQNGDDSDDEVLNDLVFDF